MRLGNFALEMRAIRNRDATDRRREVRALDAWVALTTRTVHSHTPPKREEGIGKPRDRDRDLKKMRRGSLRFEGCEEMMMRRWNDGSSGPSRATCRCLQSSAPSCATAGGILLSGSEVHHDLQWATWGWHRYLSASGCAWGGRG